MNGPRNGLCRRRAESDVASSQRQHRLRKLGRTLTPEYEYGQLRLLATSSVMLHRGLQLQVSRQSRRQMRKNFRMVAHLKRDNALVDLRRMGHDIGKVPVQGQQYGVDFLSLCNDAYTTLLCIAMCFARQLISRDQGRRLVQFWSLSPGTRLNSRSLLVTRVSPAALA
jgi:hypothetical protein